MKTFKEFILEVYDPEIQGRSTIRTRGQGGRIGAERKKTEPEKKRMKAAGGGTTAPAKSYKDRKDIGVTNSKRSPAGREQQPTQARGSAALSARDAQRKAAQERRAAKSGVKTKTASELLAKKAKKTVDPNYKPQKASGLTHRERLNKVKKGEKALRDIRLQSSGKSKESELKYPVTQKEVSRRKKKA